MSLACECSLFPILRNCASYFLIILHCRWFTSWIHYLWRHGSIYFARDPPPVPWLRFFAVAARDASKGCTLLPKHCFAYIGWQASNVPNEKSLLPKHCVAYVGWQVKQWTQWKNIASKTLLCYIGWQAMFGSNTRIIAVGNGSNQRLYIASQTLPLLQGK